MALRRVKFGARQKQMDTRKQCRRALSQAGRRFIRMPEIHRIDDRLRAQMSELVGLTIKAQRGSFPTRSRRWRTKALRFQAKRAELLHAAGYPVDYLEDIHSCPKCKDTGFIGSQMCSCLIEGYNRQLTSELSTLLKNSDERF